MSRTNRNDAPWRPTWARGRDARYHAAAHVTTTLGDAILADRRAALAVRLPSGEYRTVADLQAAMRREDEDR